VASGEQPEPVAGDANEPGLRRCCDMDAFDHNTDSDVSEDDDDERERPADGPECSPLPPLSLMERFDFERELERMLCPYPPPSVEDYYGW
jgi:hypothetical protein